MDGLQLLTATVAELIVPPYPVSLSNLSRVLTHTTDGLLDAWCKVKACQVRPLIANLLYQLHHDEETLGCLVAILQSKNIRIAFTKDESAVIVALCGFLEQSTLSLKTLHICSAIHNLSLELNLPAPKSLVDSIDRLCSNVGDLQDTTSSSDCMLAEAILAFVTSAPISFLSQLQTTTIAELTILWKRLLGSASHRSAVYAVYVAHRLAKHNTIFEDASISTTTTTIPDQLHAWVAKARSLFTGDQARNVLDTMMLVVLKGCSQIQDQDAGTSETVERCQRVICDLDPSVLKIWFLENVSVIMKLRTKSLQHVDINLQTTMMRILSVMSPDLSLPLVGTLLIKATTTTPSLVFLSIRPNLPELIEKFVVAANSALQRNSSDDSPQASLRQLISWAILWCSPGLTMNDRTFCATEVAIDIGENLLTYVSDRCQVAGIIADMFIQEAIVADWWHLSLATLGSPTNCTSLEVCPHRIEQQRQRLCTVFSLLGLQTFSTSDRILPHGTMYRFRQQLTCHKPYDAIAYCRYPTFTQYRPAYGEATESAEITPDWRRNLHEYLLDRDNVTRGKIESMVVEICRDLQIRCDNVEKPLVEARQEAEALRSDLDDVSQLLDTAKANASRQNVIIEKQKTEKEIQFARSERLEAELRNVTQSLENHQLQILDIGQKNELAKENYECCLAEREVETHRATLEAQQIHDSQISKLEEKLRAKTQAETSLETENGWLKDEMIRTRQELDSAHSIALLAVEERHVSDCSALKKQVQDLETKSIAQINDLREVREGLAENYDANKQLSKRLRDAHTDLEERSTTIEDRDRTIDSLQNSLRQEQDETRRLSEQQETDAAERASLETCIRKLELSQMSLQKRCQAQTKALENAKKAEERVIAIFQGHKKAVPSSAASTASATPSQIRRTSVQSLPRFSLASEDEEDYSEVTEM